MMQQKSRVTSSQTVEQVFDFVLFYFAGGLVALSCIHCKFCFELKFLCKNDAEFLLLFHRNMHAMSYLSTPRLQVQCIFIVNFQVSRLPSILAPKADVHAAGDYGRTLLVQLTRVERHI